MSVLKQFYRLAKPFWFQKQQWREWLLMAIVISFTLFAITISVWIAAWDKRFYDALAAFDGKAMPALISEYLMYMALIIGCGVCGDWLKKRLVFRWRTNLTAAFQKNWLDKYKHYRLQFTGEPDNPDQRIAEDIALLADKSIMLFRSFINNVAKFSAFVAVLWHLSGVQTFEIGGKTFTVYGYLVWVALIYSAISTALAHWIGHRLKDLNIERQHREADYRVALLRVRDHSEQIAFYGGSQAEQGRLKQRFLNIRNNWFRLTNCEFRQETFWGIYVRISIFIPIIATLPMYLAKTLTFGDMMQTRTSFARVQDSFGWFTDVYRSLAEWAAVVERLGSFQTALDDLDENSQTALPKNESGASEVGVSVKDLVVHTHQGKALTQPINFEIKTPGWLLLEGRSGVGKSSLLRVLSGLSPYYQGQFDLHGNCLFLPQRPYLPQDSLRSVISYPNTEHSDDEQIIQVLEKVGLGRLKNDLDTPQEWHSILSGGEQQRLSLARALLNPPQILFLDEATNQLDDESAKELMLMLKREMPQILCLAITHQECLKELFAKRIGLEKHKA